MAEYIDRNLIEWYGCDFEDGSCEYRECSECSQAECLHTQVMQIPIVNAILIPEGATNGNMIKAMFPNAKTWEVTRDDIHCAFIEFNDICEIKSFPLSWWNAPYKAEMESEE